MELPIIHCVTIMIKSFVGAQLKENLTVWELGPDWKNCDGIQLFLRQHLRHKGSENMTSIQQGSIMSPFTFQKSKSLGLSLQLGPVAEIAL